ncbi:phosphotransferase family protein [Saccharibacillus kuerlensis]|uniref:6'-aminoglycoside N-acetyltransferase n=1 Tax=Saccharibacillus kuerlensis TaxID=459527 RepID=A0ABQ2L4U4_9BACL|nr:phosphotransferase [Saccharibacillus kuerlensis]GGO02346.1 6'-aminoglycoside N-acetyltransferase [Saccharibacillus kuerlensis]
MSNPFARRLQEVYPEMLITDVQTERSAQHYIVFTVNYSLVFRFARDKAGAKALQVEARELLPAISQAVHIRIPVVMMESLEHLEPGFAFIGYKRIEGEPLWPNTLEALAGTEAEERAAAAIAGFLRELHTVRLPQDAPESEDGDDRDADNCEEPYGTGNRNDAAHLPAKRLRKRVHQELFPLMNENKQKFAEKDLAALVELTEAEPTDRTLIHGAFGPAHIIWDDENEEIAGVIGFGSTRAGDPAIDLAGVLIGYGPGFFAKVLTLYGINDELEQRSRLYACLMPLREALHGLDEGDDEILAYGLEMYAEERTGQ